MGGSPFGARDGEPPQGSPVSQPVDSIPLDRRERIDRMRARSWVLQILYLWDAQDPGHALSEAMDTVFRTRRVSPERIPIVLRYVEILEQHLQQIDKAITDSMDNWRLDRLSRVDRAVLRVAVAEILFPGDVPPKVAIQEGIRLAGQYGGEDSPRFVNGILDAVYRTHPGRRDSP